MPMLQENNISPFKGPSHATRPRSISFFYRLVFIACGSMLIWSLNHPGSTNSYRQARPSRDISTRSLPNENKKSTVKSYKDFTACTKPITNVAFLKTHKTGSSTMSNIMLRFADSHNLTVGLPLRHHWELGGYPAFIDRRLIDPPLANYDILGHHFRLKIENVYKIMKEDTRFITILRRPIDNVESVFGFFQDQSPFKDWLRHINASTTALRLKAFYDNPEKYYNRNTEWYFRAKNYMFFDLGYDESTTDEAYIGAKIAEIEEIFTFVLLTDYFDESLILLKHKLCWNWEDINYIKFKMRIKEAKTDVDRELGEKILKWNYADHKLYQHFNNSFWKQVDAYGRLRMNENLVIFRRKQKESESLCIESYRPFKKKPWMVGAKLRPKPSMECKRLAWSETVYGEMLREKMYRSLPGLNKLTSQQEKEQVELFDKVTTNSLRHYKPMRAK